MQTDNSETITILIGAEANVNIRVVTGETPLHVAAASTNYSSTVTTLFEAGADLNATDAYGRTPLHMSAYNSSLEVMTAFLDFVSGVNTRNAEGNTPLHLAARYNENPEIITTLLGAGADGAAVNEDGQAPIDLAKDNDALAGTDAYWALNDARFE